MLSSSDDWWSALAIESRENAFTRCDRISHEAKTKKRMNEMDMNEYEKVTKVTSRSGRKFSSELWGNLSRFLRRFLPPVESWRVTRYLSSDFGSIVLEMIQAHLDRVVGATSVTARSRFVPEKFVPFVSQQHFFARPDRKPTFSIKKWNLLMSNYVRRVCLYDCVLFN